MKNFIIGLSVGSVVTYFITKKRPSSFGIIDPVYHGGGRSIIDPVYHGGGRSIIDPVYNKRKTR